MSHYILRTYKGPTKLCCLVNYKRMCTSCGLRQCRECEHEEYTLHDGTDSYRFIWDVRTKETNTTPEYYRVCDGEFTFLK